MPHLDVVEEEVRVGEVEDNLLHPVSELGEGGRVLVVGRGELAVEEALEHDYGFVEVPDEYPVGPGLRRVGRADAVAAPALPPAAPAGLRAATCAQHVILHYRMVQRSRY